MKKTIFLLTALFACITYGQNHCAQDIYQQKIFAEDPSLKPENNRAYQELEEFTRNFKTDDSDIRYRRGINDLTIGTDYIIPVVVHIIHDNGVENISDAAVVRSIEMLNTFFEGKSAYDHNIDSDFTAVRGAFTTKKIRFVLAKFDPNGDPTNGIDRHQDAYYTIRGDNNNMRQNYHWPRENYFNIYVVRQAVATSGTSGFATFPPNVASAANAYLDGHVMSAWAYGEHDEMHRTWYHNLAHEVGHWLNVYHIWANAGGNGNATHCSSDDSVADTPNTIGNSYANYGDFPGVGSITNCSTKDNITNMMDYTSAFYAMFTQGQKARMEAALNSSVADRNNLWSINNVLAKLYGCTTGTDTDNDEIPDSCDDCPNDASNDSDGDGVCDGVDLCNGYPDVDLDANPGTADACDPLLPIINFNSKTILSYDPAQDNGVSINYDNGATFHVSLNGWKAIDLNYNITADTVLEFDFMSTIDGEIHYIGIDDDLTLDPLLIFKLYGTQSVTASSVFNLDYNTYTDTDQFTYKHYSIPIGSFYTGNAPYLVLAADNDLYDNKFSGNNYPGGGSYNDGTSFFRNVKIYENNTLSNINSGDIASSIVLYPNPANNEVVISTRKGDLLSKLTIHDINGKLLNTINGNQQSHQKISINNLSSGVYFMNIESNKGSVTKKLIKM